MSNSILKLTLTLMLGCISSISYAACPAGQNEVIVTIITDNYGYEGYWEIVPFGNNCGTGTLISGGNNTQVGCNGGGSPFTSTLGNGYPNKTTISSAPICLTTGSTYTLKYIDDRGDGGFKFKINIEGLPIYTYEGNSANNSFNFIVKPAPSYDLSVDEIKMPMYIQPSSKAIEGAIFNFGSTTITSFNLNYTINGGSIVSQNITGVNIPGYTSYSYSHSTPWVSTTNGNYIIDVWANNLNGSNIDSNPANDHKMFTVVVGNAIPNILDDYRTSIHSFTTIADASNGIILPRDLDFHPVLTRNELWISLQSTEAVGGKTAKISSAGQSGQNVLVQKDGNAWHFMSMPTAIAFSDNGNFCTSPGILDANHTTTSASDHFTGPALWSSDPAIYAKPSGGNGSHLDMLHQCPYAMGATWEVDNVFWVYDAYNSDLMRCDFGKDHGPGNDDHSNGKVKAYEDFPVSYINLDIPCHMALDGNKKWLYIVNGGGNKIIRMDITTGSQSGTFTPYAEPLSENSVYTGTTNSEYITTGFTQPSGIDIVGNRLIVSDYATGDIKLFDCSGATPISLATIKTGTAGVQGVKIGPDGKIWYVNRLNNTVMKVDYTLVSTDINTVSNENNFSIYPNPANEFVYINNISKQAIQSISLIDITGKVIANYHDQTDKIDVSNIASGFYTLSINTLNRSSNYKLKIGNNQ